MPRLAPAVFQVRQDRVTPARQMTPNLVSAPRLQRGFEMTAARVLTQATKVRGGGLAAEALADGERLRSILPGGPHVITALQSMAAKQLAQPFVGELRF